MCNELLTFPSFEFECRVYYCLVTARQRPVGQRLLIIDPARSHSDTPHSVGLLWTNDQPDPQTSTYQHTALTIHALGGIRTHKPSKRAAADPSLRSRGHWDRQVKFRLLHLKKRNTLGKRIYIQCVPLATETGISLIMLPLMRIL